MNAKTLSLALGEVDERFITEALNYQCKAKRKWTKWSTLAACFVVVLTLCGFCYVAYVYWGVGPTENIDFDDLTQPFGTVASDQGTSEGADAVFYEKSDLINDYTDVYAENSVCVALNDSSIPSIYFSPNYMVIFTQQNKDGWMLSKGDKFTINFSLYKKLRLDIGYILNGTYYELSTGGMGPEFGDTITAPEDGIYYFCITNRSSANAVITSGEIMKESK